MGEQWNTMHQYFLKVVPTFYQPLRGGQIHTNQFSTTKNAKAINLAAGGAGLPGVFFFYDFSSIRITYAEQRSSFLHFLTGACAIVGGVFTISGLVDGFVYYGQKKLGGKNT